MSDPDTSAAPAPVTPEAPPAQPDDATASGSPTPVDATHEPDARIDPAQSEAGYPLPDPIPHAGARYAALRLLMFLAVAGILYLVGMRGWLLAFASILISGVVSLFMFMKQRNDAAVNLERRVEEWKHRHDHEDGEPAQS